MRIHFVASNDQFIKLIINELAQRGHVCTTAPAFNSDDVAQADLIWCEFVDENAIAVAEYVTPAKKILRVHRDEVFTSIWTLFNADAYDAVIFVSDVIKRELEERSGRTLANAKVIPHYIPTGNYNVPADKGRNNKIGYAGYICRKEGIGELLFIAESLPEYEFYIAGELKEPDFMEFIMGRCPRNLHIEPWANDIPGFFAGKAYVINTALSESFSVTTVEAMLCGCKPVVRHWRGAEDIYPEASLYNNMSDIKRILAGDFKPEAYRDHAAGLACDTTVAQIDTLIEQLFREHETELPSLTVAVVQTRVKWLPQLLHSLRMQNYPFVVDILQNIDRDKTIGQCFNELADRCTTEWILYVGDDDWLAENYIRSVMESYLLRARIYPSTQALITSTVAFSEDGRFMVIPHYSTGFWRAEFVRTTRYDETLVRQVDTEFHTRVQTMQTGNAVIINMPWIAGYFYRQHGKNVSGNKFTEGANTSQTPEKE